MQHGTTYRSRWRQALRRLDNAMFMRSRYSQPMMPVLCLIGSVFAPLYYLIWTRWLPQPYENPALHVISMLLLLPLAAQRWWSPRFRPLLPALWYLTITYVLPFFFGYLALRNGLTLMWATAHMFALFTTMMLFDLASFAAIVGVGSLAAVVAFQFGPHEGWPLHAIAQYAPVLLLSVVLGPLASLSQKFADAARVNALTAASNNIAHELRTPLGSMQIAGRALRRFLPGLLESHRLAQQAGLPVMELRTTHLEALKRGIDVIEHEVAHANTVIDMLLLAARPMGQPQFEKVDARTCVEDALDRYPYASRGERERVHLHESGGDFLLLGSRTLLMHVIFNLVRNALLHTGRAGKGSIEVRLLSTSREHQIRVRDTGPGIRPDVLPRIFNRFYSHSDRAEGVPGLGIGLAFSQDAVERMGGQIHCHSAWGVYTEFVLSFPVRKEALA